MPQTYNLGATGTGAGGNAAAAASCGLQGPLTQNRFHINLIGGETWELPICVCEEMFTVDSVVPGSNQIGLKNRPCAPVGGCVKVWCHDADCGVTLDGVHEVAAVDTANYSVTVNTDLSEFEAESFTSTPSIVSSVCVTEAASAPSGCNLKDISAYQIVGRVTNRIPGNKTRLAVVVRVVATNIIQLVEEENQVFPGDSITIGNAGISNATVLRRWNEHGSEWLEVDQVATVEPDNERCYSATTEVGVIADMQYEFSTGCGCAKVFIPAEMTNRLPQIGSAMEQNEAGEYVQPFYELGVFSIFAQYLDADLQIYRELLGQGGVTYTPSTYAQV